MFNPVIIVAIIVQSLVSKVDRIAGAVLGFLITTGIFLWGLSVYAEGNQIALFTIPLSQPVFLIACRSGMASARVNLWSPEKNCWRSARC